MRPVLEHPSSLDSLLYHLIGKNSKLCLLEARNLQWRATPTPVFTWNPEGVYRPSVLKAMTERKKYHSSAQEAYCNTSTVTSSFVS